MGAKASYLIHPLLWELFSLGVWAVIKTIARTDKAREPCPESWQTSIAEQSVIVETDLFQALVQVEFIPSHLQERLTKNGMHHNDIWLLKVYNLCAYRLLSEGNKKRENNKAFLYTCAYQHVHVLIQA